MNSQDEFEPVWAVGFMSGTSLDAVDVAMIRTDGERIFEFGPVAEHTYTVGERAVLQMATDEARRWNWTGPRPYRIFGIAEQIIANTYESAFKKLMSIWDGESPHLYGVHGQTVLHRRPFSSQIGATLQLCPASKLKQMFGGTLVYDFRSADVAAGGQGAPLAPVYHNALMKLLGDEPACILNLGGVANITARNRDGSLLAFDTGPANGPIDEWIEGHDRGRFDADGKIAGSGRVHEGLLAQLMEHPWFAEEPPKSLDRYDFNASMARGLSFEDGAATLTEFSARAVAAGVAQLEDAPTKVITCGGGRRNPVLMQALRSNLACPVLTAEEVGWNGDAIEAQAFAFLAVRSLRGLPISWPGTTGAPRPLEGGVILGVSEV